MKIANILLAVALLLSPVGWYLAHMLFFTTSSFASKAELDEMQEKLTALTIDFNSLQQQITAQGQRAAGGGCANNNLLRQYQRNQWLGGYIHAGREHRQSA